MGNGYLGIKWSRDRRRHVTQKGQGRDRNMIRAQYRENDWRYRLIGCNGVLHEMGGGESNGQVLDDVACAGLLIRN